jgi:predicted molibdopterin-dependent oxidoreductase YjgC
MKTTDELNIEKENLKKIHGKVREMVVYLDTDDDEKTATLFLKKPDKSTRKMVGSLVNKDKFEMAVEGCLKALYIGGDSLDLVIGNDDAIESAGQGVVDLLAVQKATLKKN